MTESSEPRQSAWIRRRDRVMGGDQNDPSLALGEGEWRLDPKSRVRRWTPTPAPHRKTQQGES